LFYLFPGRSSLFFPTSIVIFLPCLSTRVPTCAFSLPFSPQRHPNRFPEKLTVPPPTFRPLLLSFSVYCRSGYMVGSFQPLLGFSSGRLFSSGLPGNSRILSSWRPFPLSWPPEIPGFPFAAVTPRTKLGASSAWFWVPPPCQIFLVMVWGPFPFFPLFFQCCCPPREGEILFIRVIP